MAACITAYLSLNVCNEIMKREIDFNPRTAERSIMVDWPRILGPWPRPWFSVLLPVFPSPPVPPGDAWRALSRPKWKTMTVASEENLVPTQNEGNGAASQERGNKFWEMNVSLLDGGESREKGLWDDATWEKWTIFSHCFSSLYCLKLSKLREETLLNAAVQSVTIICFIVIVIIR